MIPNKELRKFVYDKIYGQITVGSIIPVYSLAPVSASFPFIHIDKINSVADGPKDSNSYTSRVYINIYDQYPDEGANWDKSEDIASEIDRLLNHIYGDTLNWEISLAFIESIDTLEEITDTRRALVTTIVMNYYVEQN